MPSVYRIAICIGLFYSCNWSTVPHACGQSPPFSGTAFLRDNIITDEDWSAFDSMTYVGMQQRLVFDRRVNQWLFQPMHLFDATFFDGLDSEIQINPEFGDSAAAAVEADKYARAVGRLPTSMRTDVDSVTVHQGLQPFGGGNNNILIHTDQADQYGGYLEEILFHEAAHTSYDSYHSSAPGWLSAQQLDPTFISTYAQDNPTREDIAESILPWFALRYTDALYPFQIDAINDSIPNRLAYFDALLFQLNEPPLIPGDFNEDGSVNGADLPYWESHYGMVSGADVGNGDADGDGDVDGQDFLIWQEQSTIPSSQSTELNTVPEPGSLALIGVGLTVFVMRRHLTARGVDVKSAYSTG